MGDRPSGGDGHRNLDLSLTAHPARLAGWGRYPVSEGPLVSPADTAEAVVAAGLGNGTIARGNARSYGDASMGRELTVAARRLGRFLAFDAATGTLICEGGVLLSEIIDAMLPRGWFAPVTPGTRFVTLGGMIAADIHGKNHHGHGSLCDHIEWLDLATGDAVLRCSRTEHPELFAATCGGMGLTGVILRAALRLLAVPSAMIRQRGVRAGSLSAAIELFESSLDWTYSVAWIDCLASGASLGRSVVLLGEHAEVDELPDPAMRANPYARAPDKVKRVPIDFPAFALNPRSVRAFNQLYYRVQRTGERIVPLNPYFYPLDAILEWNRIYGRRGFVQYQCVLPLAESRAGLTRLLQEIARAGTGSFLAVLKRMGAESFGLLSFPHPGYTLALDFPVTPANLALLDRLDAITAEHGGRIYLAKDGRAKPSFAAGYPKIDQFRAIRAEYGLTDRFASRLSQRLEL